MEMADVHVLDYAALDAKAKSGLGERASDYDRKEGADLEELAETTGVSWVWWKV
jgi:hypothetical protein